MHVHVSGPCGLAPPVGSPELDRVQNLYMLFAGWEVRMVKNCDRGQHSQARGHGFSLYGPGGSFSKAPETFRGRKAIAKSQTLRLQSCEINKFQR